MTSRQAGQRINIIAVRRGGKRQKSAGPRRTAGRRSQPVRPAERRHLFQLVACASIFVLLVAVKLLLPGRVGPLGEKISEALERNMDVQAVFSAVGRLPARLTGIRPGRKFSRRFSSLRQKQRRRTAAYWRPRFLRKQGWKPYRNWDSSRRLQKKSPKFPR